MANRGKEGGVEYIQIDGLVSDFYVIVNVRIKPMRSKIVVADLFASL